MPKLGSYILILMLACSTSAFAHTQPYVTSEKLQGYRLAFRDEFNDKKLDTGAWYYRKGARLRSTQLPENVTVLDGKLHLVLKKQKTALSEYTAGGIISKKMFKYGYYEARFKCPPTRGWHTSFWLDWYTEDKALKSSGSNQEIDICENDSVTLTRYTTNLIIWKPERKAVKKTPVKTPDLSADYHIYGCEVRPDAIRYFFDGQLVETLSTENIKMDDMAIWLTSVADGKVNDSNLPVLASYDWVRYYEKIGGYPEEVTKTPSKH